MDYKGNIITIKDIFKIYTYSTRILFLRENNIIYKHINYLNPKAKYFKDIQNYIQNKSNVHFI
jgi:hypothetical protein